MRRAVSASAQHSLDALTLQLAPAQRGRRLLFERSDALVEAVERERDAFEPFDASSIRSSRAPTPSSRRRSWRRDSVLIPGAGSPPDEAYVRAATKRCASDAQSARVGFEWAGEHCEPAILSTPSPSVQCSHRGHAGAAHAWPGSRYLRRVGGDTQRRRSASAARRADTNAFWPARRCAGYRDLSGPSSGAGSSEPGAANRLAEVSGQTAPRRCRASHAT